MHYYPFDVAQHALDSLHMTLMQDLAFRRLTDLYFTTEGPLQGTVPSITRAVRMPVADVRYVLQDQFKKTDAGWQKERYEKVIAKVRRMVGNHWAKNLPKPVRAEIANRRRATQRSATPPWLSKDQIRQMTDIYVAAHARGMEVDHIVPLVNPSVCGLHVPWNLEPLTQADNRAKSNSFDGGWD